MADSFAEASAEIDRLRKLIPERPDWHLNNWARWCREEKLAAGYKTHSGCLENMKAANNETDDIRDETNHDWAASVCDAVIDSLSRTHRDAISNVYASRVMAFRPGYEERWLIEAAAEFWVLAQERDLV